MCYKKIVANDNNYKEEEDEGESGGSIAVAA